MAHPLSLARLRFATSRGRLALLAATLALLLAACGSDGAPASPGQPSTAAAPDTTTPPLSEAEAPTPEDPLPGNAAAAAGEPGSPAAALAWAPLPTGELAPDPRSDAVLAFDPQRQTLYLHGGRSKGNTLADLWAYDLRQGAWTSLVPAGDAPTARFGHNALFDQSRGRFLVFGGQGRGNEFFSDVWAYDPAADAWTRLADNGVGPTDRYGSCIGYDGPADRFLISHGFTHDGRFDDTWAFSLADDTWTDISPDSPRPGERCLHTCVYDTAANALVLFGGQNNSVSQLGDTWVLQDQVWTEVAGDAPSARRFAVSAPVTGGLWLFGGIGQDGRTSDLWTFDVQNRLWAPTSAAAAPAARYSHAAALDDATARLFVFGGNGADGELNDLWMLRSS